MALKKKNPHAVAMGRKGGKARALKLTPKQLSAAGKKAVAAREAKREAERSKEHQRNRKYARKLDSGCVEKARAKAAKS